MKKYLPHIFFIVLFAVFFFKGAVVLDPDLGWHLKMGEHILGHGIPQGDPFSYTMPSYPFVDHEWLTNIAMHLLYVRTGVAGLIVVFAAMAAAAVMKLAGAAEGGWRIFFGTAILCVLFPFAGVRPQEITWLFTILYLSVLERGRVRWLLVPLMVVWVNLHGGFFIGVFIVGLYAAARILEKKPPARDILLFTGVLAATLVNPYGPRIWWEVGMQLTDSSLRFFVSEWMPALFFMNFVYWLYLVFAAVVVVKYRRSIPLFSRLLFLLFFLAGLSSMRNIPLWMIASATPVVLGLRGFLREAGRTSESRRRLRFVAVRLVAGALVVIVLQILMMGFSALSAVQYPEKAVAYLKSHRLDGRMIAAYGWGGYLIWRLPDRRVFIDGRMPSWRRDDAPAGESANARKDYENFFGSENGMRMVGEKYRIRYVLVQSAPEMTAVEKTVQRFFSLKPKKAAPIYSLPSLYDDGVATIRVLR